MNNAVAEIKNYILFLKRTCNLELTLHPYRDEHLISDSELISFHIHENPYCVYVKTFAEAQEHCILRQRRVFERGESGSFCGACYAGVREYVYPIYDNTAPVGFISVSGYKPPNFVEYAEKCSRDYSIPLENLEKIGRTLKNEMPDKAYVDTVIAPLVRMLELAYSKMGNVGSDDSTIGRIIRYVNCHYAENITAKQLCEIFSCSRSYIFHKFKEKTGKTFHAHLMELRLMTAKSLLVNSSLGVSEIAYAVGFNDSNYFSACFKAQIGISPREYRNRLM